MRVLSWNLFHGRSLPPSRSGLAEPFARLIAAWEWDVALLQEVPPWWPDELARRDVDHLFARGLERVGEQRLLDARVSLNGRELTLSDHPPLWVQLAAPDARRGAQD